MMKISTRMFDDQNNYEQFDSYDEIQWTNNF